MIILRPANIRKFNRRFHHSTGSISIKRQNTRRKRTMICSNTHGAVQLFTFLNQRKHGIEQILPLLHIIIFRLINLFFKILPSICKVSRIDPNLLHRIRNHECNLGLKMHIRTKRNVIALLKQPFTNLHGCIRLTLSLNGNPHKIKSLIRTSHDLLNRFLHVGSIGSGHGLSNNGMIRSEFDRATFDRTSFSAHDGVKVLAVVGDGSEDFVTCSRFDRGGPLYVCVDGRVVRHSEGRL
mmetsp:Transcript_9732/g.18271  ORF Transcript_9732/g.18271 Transcript_9732/m.18271 type:complete len:238 (-) Transcript_9732:219-932(-)